MFKTTTFDISLKTGFCRLSAWMPRIYKYRIEKKAKQTILLIEGFSLSFGRLFASMRTCVYACVHVYVYVYLEPHTVYYILEHTKKHIYPYIYRDTYVFIYYV